MCLHCDLRCFRYGRGLKLLIHICRLCVNLGPLSAVCGVILIPLINSVTTISSPGKRLVNLSAALYCLLICIYLCMYMASVLLYLGYQVVPRGLWEIFGDCKRSTFCWLDAFSHAQ